MAIREMSGEYKDGAMRYSGQVFSRSGTVMTRVTLYNLAPDRVRHMQEESTDGGKTWSPFGTQSIFGKPKSHS